MFSKVGKFVSKLRDFPDKRRQKKRGKTLGFGLTKSLIESFRYLQLINEHFVWATDKRLKMPRREKDKSSATAFKEDNSLQKQTEHQDSLSR